MPSGAAHAGGPNFGVLVGGTDGSGESCPDWSQNKPGVYLYSNINYEGRCAYFTPKIATQPFNIDAINRTLHNDAASSLRMRGVAGVDMYKDKDFRGQIFSYNTDIPDFRNCIYDDGTTLNDSVSSLVVWGH